MSSRQSLHFSKFAALLDSNPDILIIKPRESKSKGGIQTGSLKYMVQSVAGSYQSNICLTGPPVKMWPIARGGTVLYAKGTMRVLGEDDLANIDQLTGTDKAVADFMILARKLEEKVLELVRKDPKTYFMRPVEPSAVTIRSVLRPNNKPEYKDMHMECKLELMEGTNNSSGENYSPSDIRLAIVDAHKKEPIDINEMNMNDVYVPVFDSIYPSFNRTNEVSLKWKLACLNCIEKGGGGGGSDAYPDGQPSWVPVVDGLDMYMTGGGAKRAAEEAISDEGDDNTVDAKKVKEAAE